MLRDIQTVLTKELIAGLVGRDIEAVALATALAPKSNKEALVEAIQEKQESQRKRKKFSMTPPEPENKEVTPTKKGWVNQ